MGLGDYVQLAAIDPAWCDNLVKTGSLAGSDYTTWRICDRDILATEWTQAEVLTSLGKDGRTVWKPL